MRKNVQLGGIWFMGLSGFFLLLVVLVVPSVGAAEDLQALKNQLKILSEQMKTVEKQLEELQSKEAEKTEEIEDIDDRLNKAELHTATDKISFGVELRSKVESLHYNDIRMAPGQMVNSFFTDVNPQVAGMRAADFAGIMQTMTPAQVQMMMSQLPGGFNGATLDQIQGMMGLMNFAGLVPPAEKHDADNDTIFTNRFRLNMKAKVNQNLSFGGRLSAYKVFGDSTGVKFNQGSLGDVTFDGNTSSLPHGDVIRLERAYFNYKQALGPVPVNFSLGRRPSTDGPPLEYSNYSLEGGSPLATIINWQFDGASLNFGLEDVTGIPGAAFKLCYGVGFEGDWGNTFSLNETRPQVDDVHLWGFITTLFDNDTTSAVLNYAHASDITDGFTGLTVMPFIISRQDTNGDGQNEYYFSPNSGGFITRLEPSTNLGDWDAASLLFRTNFSELFADIDLFVAGSWTHTDPDRISQNPFYEMMGQGLLSSNGELESHDGYSVYAGMVFPMPKEGRLGIEYNWGSKYWFNFTGAEDSLVGSKMAVRGSVYEAYYVQPIFGRNFFVKLGGQLYDYAYTGSGNPLGEPVKISKVTGMDALNAVVDDVWAAYLSVTMRF